MVSQPARPCSGVFPLSPRTETFYCSIDELLIYLFLKKLLSLEVKKHLSSSLSCDYRLPIWIWYSILPVWDSVWTVFYYMLQANCIFQSSREIVFSFNFLANLIREKLTLMLKHSFKLFSKF